MNYEIEITRRCNVRCPGCDHLCDYIYDPTSDMTMPDVKSLVTQINEADPFIPKVFISGGEATLHNDCVDICKYIKENTRNVGSFEFFTNNSNTDISRKVSRLGFNVHSDGVADNPAETIKNKTARHFNSEISPKEAGLATIKQINCSAVHGRIGVNVHRFRSRLVWCWCPLGSSVCKLLNREDYLFPTLKDLLLSDLNKFIQDVCPHCELLACRPVKVKDTMGKVSECFRQGLENMIEYNKSVNKQEV